MNPYAIETCTMGGPCEFGVEGSPWRYRYGFDGNYSPAVLYFASLQYCAGLITGGETGLSPGLPLERVFTICICIVGVLVNSMVTGEILLIMNRVAERRMDFDDRMSQAREFMTARSVASQLQLRVYRHLETQHQILYGHSASNRDFM